MTQTAEASPDSRPLLATVRAFVEAHALWIGVGAVAAAASGFLLHQLMAWPPHEDETLALFVGRDSLAGVVEHVTRDRGGAPLHFLFAYAVAHLGLGLGSLRLVSAVFAVASLPLIALLGPSSRRTLRGADRDRTRRRQLGVPLPRRLRPDVQPVPVPLAAVVRPSAPRARSWHVEELDALGRRHPARGRIASLRRPRSGGPGRVRARRAPGAPATGGGRVRGRGGRRHAVLAHRPRARGPVRRRRRRPRRQARRPVGDRHVPVADGRRLQHRPLARSHRRAGARADRARDGGHRSPSARALRDRRPRGGVPRCAPRRLDVTRVAPPHLRPAVLRHPRSCGNAA